MWLGGRKMASKHNVVCVSCGRQFDANKSGTRYFPEKRRYMCGSCARKIKAAEKAQQKAEKEERQRAISEAVASGEMNENQATIASHKHGKGKMIAGIIVAAVGVIGFAGGSGQGIAYFITCIIILLVGAGLLIWHFIADKKFKEAVQAERERSLSEQQTILHQQENQTKTCPNCGGITKGKFCEYCGSQLEQ